MGLGLESTKDADKLRAAKGMPGAGLTGTVRRKVPSERLALKPYWGKPAVRNFREGDGNTGHHRSPIRVSPPGSQGPVISGVTGTQGPTR
jgi:hypothetical protein